MIDFHCHLDLYPSPEIIRKEVEARSIYVLAVTTTPKAWCGTNKVFAGSPKIRIALGLHPELAAQRHNELPLFCSLIGETKYVGEIGLDGSPSHRGSLSIQKEVFSGILDACQQAGGRLLSIHSRGAATEVLSFLERFPKAGTAIFHWFSGKPTEQKRIIEAGHWFSVGPAMLRSASGKAVIAAIPRNRILTESDGPLAGNGIFPWSVREVENHLREIWACDSASVTHQLRFNLQSLLLGSSISMR